MQMIGLGAVSRHHADWYSAAGCMSGVMTVVLPARREQSPKQASEALSSSFARLRKEQRHHLLEQIASGRMSPNESVRQTDAFLWMDHVSYHLWRVVFYLDPESAGEAQITPVEQPLVMADNGA